MANNLELSILTGVSRANRSYYKLTGGWDLSHAPESFLQTQVALAIHQEAGHEVYIDASPVKIAREFDGTTGKVPADLRLQRFDVVAWRKSANRLRSILEVKRAWGPGSVVQDAKKIENYLKHGPYDVSGYLLVYTAKWADKGRSDSKNALQERLSKWCNAMPGWDLVDIRHKWYPEAGDERPWAWICGLYRYDTP